MKSIIYYWTGTGNSLWTAQLVSKELGGANLVSMSGKDSALLDHKADAVGFVFPVHMWGIPSLVIKFIQSLKNDPTKYYFAYAVNAGQVSRTLIQLKELLESRGLKLSAGYDIILPSNYIPWGGPGSKEYLHSLYRSAEEKIKKSVSGILKREDLSIERGPLWQRIVFTALYKMTFNMVPNLDKNFWVDDKCNSCSICEKVCPSLNIEIQDGKPIWLHRCEQCLACIQWCPKEAIQYGKKTPAYERYHHPEIKPADIIASSGNKFRNSKGVIKRVK